MLSDQLYQIKSKELATGAGAGGDGEDAGGLLDFGVAEKIQKDKHVEILKRNHDLMMEKYETYRLRNEGLEKKAMEKENLYVVIKAENDNLANQVYQLKRQLEDTR